MAMALFTQGLDAISLSGRDTSASARDEGLVRDWPGGLRRPGTERQKLVHPLSRPGLLHQIFRKRLQQPYSPTRRLTGDSVCDRDGGCVVKVNRPSAIGAAVLAAASVVAACSNSATNQETASPAPTQTVSAAPAAAHNHDDVMFAHHMIPHHQQAVEMSDMILEKQGIDSRVADMARQIKEAQGPEIEQMQGWLDQWGMPGPGRMSGPKGTGGNMPPGHGGMHGSGTEAPSPPASPAPSGSMTPGMPGMGNMPGMEGMMSPADMQALQRAQGVEASRLFLTQMIRHHQGAITMAQNEVDNGQFPDAVALAKSMVSSQQKEIDTMNEILKSL